MTAVLDVPTMPNGPRKKFYLVKLYGQALRAMGCEVDLRTLGCDEIMGLLRQYKIL